MSHEIHHYNRVREDHDDKSYRFLWNTCKTHLKREQQTKNKEDTSRWNRMMHSGLKSPSASSPAAPGASPARGRPSPGRRPTQGRGRSKSQSSSRSSRRAPRTPTPPSNRNRTPSPRLSPRGGSPGNGKGGKPASPRGVLKNPPAAGPKGNLRPPSPGKGQSPRRGSGNSPKGGGHLTPRRQLTIARKARTQCAAFERGECRFGQKCQYCHAG